MILIKLLCNFIKMTIRHGCSPANLLHFLRTRIFLGPPPESFLWNRNELLWSQSQSWSAWSYGVISPHRCIPTLTHLFLIFANLIIEFFEWEKWNTATVTFKQASITCRWIIHILYEARNYRYSNLCKQTRLV